MPIMRYLVSQVAIRSAMNIILLPNILSVSRCVLALPMGYFIVQGAWLYASIILWIAIATDIADGQLARYLSSQSNLGSVLDHGSDAIFVTIMLAALVYHELVPIVLPVLIPIAFLQYMLDSKALAGKSLRTSILGRHNGICYFILGGFPIMQHALKIYPIEASTIFWVGWGLLLSTIVSMVDRLLSLLRGVNK
ncbi:MAG TPA: hypothetical protein DCM54_14660 [Gammaproteobacteria bacterium]|nr:hypothetical protein [Gammaproteobacteria bacterium]